MGPENQLNEISHYFSIYFGLILIEGQFLSGRGGAGAPGRRSYGT